MVREEFRPWRVAKSLSRSQTLTLRFMGPISTRFFLLDLVKLEKKGKIDWQKLVSGFARKPPISHIVERANVAK
jgi:hypothetical protein